MKKIYILVFIILVIVGVKASAQEYEVPKHYIFKTNADYLTAEPEILKTINWLEKTPWHQETRKRDEAKAFVLKWIDGSPDVTINLNSEVVHLAKDNPELLGSYMFGYTKYALLHKTDFDDTKAKKSGVKAIIDKYAAESSHRQNSEVDKVTAIDKEGKLDNWITTDFNVH